MPSTDSVPDEPDTDRPPPVPDESDTDRPPPDEREVVVNRILDTGHGPFIEPRPALTAGMAGSVNNSEPPLRERSLLGCGPRRPATR